MIVDTNVLIRLMQGDEDATRKIRELEDEHVPLALSSMTLFELYHSVERVDSPDERRRKIASVIDSKPTYPADGAVMKKAGRLDGRLTDDGRQVGIGDTVIAATALVHEEPVLTENVAHFERIDGLEVESY
ncbi:nucleic acid-binding protein [Halogeometricum borinquense DSM 11551]|uniref:Ribonuclease VapC n=2 Tax=Halogeometricum borinquense TaxID=60847 RepID=E4NWJ8_HALBP|nr:type II toxin-antitoxin system VapC family toxin [Halogeometricum borinquense]ADQ69418.1 predicted nucleic acid-binding protein, contains PIN domain [Halogeometricum borinquense DSM 11551]ELY25970.1 nucleic acid-binding protein [Halogeometricum borinquense DSM 11551]RYJ19461.1 type II toxin-antitoxin system VapC family toxin [Halogeometricum borinquense]